MASYPVPVGETRIEYRQSNSRFIATIGPAPTHDVAREFLRRIRAEMPDATHHVYGFRVGFGASVTDGMSDDGEPSGTSGPPVLAVIRGSGLGDTIIVVTRYYGGTKLGTGGLVTAYSQAAREAIAASPTMLKVPRREWVLGLSYSAYQDVARRLAEADCLTLSENFGERVELVVAIPIERESALLGELRERTAGALQAQPR